jgi:hypothetical protein
VESLGKILIKTGMGIALLCLLGYVSGAHPLVLTARNGKEEDGRYYLGSRGHYLEVSRSRYQFCVWEEYAEIIAVALALSGIGVLPLHKKRIDERIP